MVRPEKRSLINRRRRGGLWPFHHRRSRTQLSTKPGRPQNSGAGFKHK